MSGTSLAIDGTDLTAFFTAYDHDHTPVTGNFVSAASASGPWSIRGSWSYSSIAAVSPAPANGHVTEVAVPVLTEDDIGYVRVYDYVASDPNGWVPRLGGDLLVGQNAGDKLGARRSVAMSDDGLVLAIGAPGFDDEDDSYSGGQATDTGKVKVWAYSTLNQVWNYRPTNFFSSTYADLQQNSVVSLSSDGTILAVGGYGHGADAATGAPTVGKVTIYDWQPDHVGGAGYWQCGMLTTGDTGSKFGWAVALSSDGMTLAVGAPYHTGGGQVKVFQAVDSANVPLSGRRIGSELAPIATSYQASEHTVWSLLDLALVEIQALQARVSALENP